LAFSTLSPHVSICGFEACRDFPPAVLALGIESGAISRFFARRRKYNPAARG